MPFPTTGDLPDPGIELVSLASPALAVRYFTTGKLSLYNVSKTMVGGKGHLFPPFPSVFLYNMWHNLVNYLLTVSPVLL